MIKFSPHIAVGVRNYEDALEFYKNSLGLELQKSDNDESEFRCGDISFYIERSDESQPTWLEFRTDDVELLKKKMEDAGCRISTTHMEKSYLVVDPYGMRFHIWEE